MTPPSTAHELARAYADGVRALLGPAGFPRGAGRASRKISDPPPRTP
jgi:hypothetical protein